MNTLPCRPMHLRPAVPMATPQAITSARDTPEVMTEMCVLPSQPIRTGRAQAQEVRRTISLPDDCREPCFSPADKMFCGLGFNVRYSDAKLEATDSHYLLATACFIHRTDETASCDLLV